MQHSGIAKKRTNSQETNSIEGKRLKKKVSVYQIETIEL